MSFSGLRPINTTDTLVIHVLKHKEMVLVELRKDRMLHKYKDQRECGFTLIELLVVILIIGILAAIAIPMFLNQRKQALDATIQSDVKNTALAMQSYFTSHPDETFAPVADIKSVVKKSNPKTAISIMGTVEDWCVTGQNPDAGKYIGGVTSGGVQPYVAYSSIRGGLNGVPTGVSNYPCWDNNRFSF